MELRQLDTARELKGPILFRLDAHRDSFNVAVRHTRLKQIAHGVNEDQLRRAPGKRLGQLFGNQTKIETLLVGMSFHPTKAFGESLGIAMLASGTDLRAATHGVPGR